MHELRARSDAVAVGDGDRARRRAAARRARRRDAARPAAAARLRRAARCRGLELELRTGPLADELAALAAEGVQSLLLEGGPTLAAAFLEADLVDKLLVFVAPVARRGDGAVLRAGYDPRGRSPIWPRLVGEDVLLEAYVHEP